MLMCESTRYGHLCTQDGSSLPTEIAARGCGLEVAHYELGLAELSAVGLIHKDRNGVIFDPDMVSFAKEWSRLQTQSGAIDARRGNDIERQEKSRVSRDMAFLSSSNLLSSGFKELQLPDWIPLELWEGFKEMRKKIRAPLTELAAKGIIRDLEAIKRGGGDPVRALEESIKRSWRGVFEQKGNGDEPIGRRQREADRAAKEAIRRMG